MSSPTWQTANGAILPKSKSDLTPDGNFTITAPPKTDIWRRSNEDDVFNAPTIYQKLKASDFKSIKVTVFAPWKTQYDQGGLVLAFEPKPASKESQNDVDPRKWIKAGIEYFALQSVIGVVGTDRFSDWSLSPMSQEHHQKATFKMLRDGTTLWIYAAQEGSEKLLPMREVKWAFMEGREESEIWVGVYAAKPTPDEGEDEEKGIEVSFSGLEVEREGEE
ncbi:hypothetical protein HII31_06378 [Pseudocercospora fuligena]|uniref:Uncharacterized protein n=1 Tax=Pseudocercospora fuligena TaxID=685502 RepID=A0A8H6RH16_9PEZI|nr:hypothetical protein HII31_06378 [Pseudocercospora fuligena]